MWIRTQQACRNNVQPTAARTDFLVTVTAGCMSILLNALGFPTNSARRFGASSSCRRVQQRGQGPHTGSTGAISLHRRRVVGSIITVGGLTTGIPCRAVVLAVRQQLANRELAHGDAGHERTASLGHGVACAVHSVESRGDAITVVGDGKSSLRPTRNRVRCLALTHAVLQVPTTPTGSSASALESVSTSTATDRKSKVSCTDSAQAKNEHTTRAASARCRALSYHQVVGRHDVVPLLQVSHFEHASRLELLHQRGTEPQPLAQRQQARDLSGRHHEV